jgi:hypothetical protein
MPTMTRSPGPETRTAARTMSRTAARTAAHTGGGHPDRRPARVHDSCCLFCFLASVSGASTATRHGATQ